MRSTPSLHTVCAWLAGGTLQYYGRNSLPRECISSDSLCTRSRVGIHSTIRTFNTIQYRRGLGTYYIIATGYYIDITHLPQPHRVNIHYSVLRGCACIPYLSCMYVCIPSVIRTPLQQQQNNEGNWLPLHNVLQCSYQPHRWTS